MKHIIKNIWVCPFFNGKSTTKAFEEKIIWHRIQVWKKSSSQILIKAITTGNRAFAVCPEICRGLNLGHPANVVFAVCRPKQHTAKERHTANEFFAVCHSPKRTANSRHTASLLLWREPAEETHGESLAHGKHVRLPCGKNQTLGKHTFCRVP